MTITALKQPLSLVSILKDSIMFKKFLPTLNTVININDVRTK